MNENQIISIAQKKLNKHVSVIQSLKNTFIFTYRSLKKMLHNPESFVDILILPILFTLMFTYVFGPAISGNISSYLPIVIPGILLQTCVTSCNAAGASLRDDITKNITSRFKAMPISRIAPLAGVLVADIIRYFVAGLIVFTIGYIIGFNPQAGFGFVVISILFVVVLAWCLSWMFGFVNIIAKSTSTANTLGMLIMFPLTFLSNAFVPTENMSSGLKFFVEEINPISRAVSAIREMLTLGTIGTDFWVSLAGVMVILIVFVPLTLWAYKHKT